MKSAVANTTTEGGAAEAIVDEEPPGHFDSASAMAQMVQESASAASLPLATVEVVSTDLPVLSPLCLPRGIVVLYRAADRLSKGEPKDLLADLEAAQTAATIARALAQHTDLEIHLLPTSLEAVRSELSRYPPQDYVVFNLFEGATGAVEEEVYAAFALRALGYRFTGAHGDALALTSNKRRTKELLAASGLILTPPWRVFGQVDEVSLDALDGMSFPLIVKPVGEHGSVGIDAGAVVSDIGSLRARVEFVMARYGEDALVESFIDGREFNIALWGDPPQVLPLAEVNFDAFADPKQRIVSFAAKWEEESFEYRSTPVTCPAVVSEQLAAHIRATALRAWEMTGCRGYARVDMRVQGDKIYVLEVNPNPSLAPDAGFARAARAAGFDYPQMILEIVSLIL